MPLDVDVVHVGKVLRERLRLFGFVIAKVAGQLSGKVCELVALQFHRVPGIGPVASGVVADEPWRLAAVLLLDVRVAVPFVRPGPLCAVAVGRSERALEGPPVARSMHAHLMAIELVRSLSPKATVLVLAHVADHLLLLLLLLCLLFRVGVLLLIIARHARDRDGPSAEMKFGGHG